MSLLPRRLANLVVVFELCDAVSRFGGWAEPFLDACCLPPPLLLSDDPTAADDGGTGTKLVCFSFCSRLELMQLVCAAGAQCAQRAGRVLVVLSSHGSTQGQVFSTTPRPVAQQFHTEEFCSVHDFYHTVLSAFGHQAAGSHDNCELVAVHLSSCFSLLITRLHRDWPVPCSWLTSSVPVPLSGSTKEQYDSGGWTADIYFILQFAVNGCSAWREMVDFARTTEFPGLASEMGVYSLPDRRLVNRKLRLRDQSDDCQPNASVPAVRATVKPVFVHSTAHGKLISNALSQSIALRADICADTDNCPLLLIACDSPSCSSSNNQISLLRQSSPIYGQINVYVDRDDVMVDAVADNAAVAAAAGGDGAAGIPADHGSWSTECTSFSNEILNVLRFDPVKTLPLLVYVIHLCVGEGWPFQEVVEEAKAMVPNLFQSPSSCCT